MQNFSREDLRQFHNRSTFRGVLIFSIDAGLYLLAVVEAVAAKWWMFKVSFALLAGLMTALLFIVGHDACHQALTGSRRLNGLLGRLAFLPSLYPFSLWDLGHNRIHHRYTNQKGLDYGWGPLTPAEYSKLSLWARLEYRFYRTPIVHLWYSPIEIWWRKMFFPRRSVIGCYRPVYWLDLGLILAWLVILPAGLVAITSSAFPGPLKAWVEI